MPYVSSAWVFDQDGDITVHIPYIVDNPPYDAVNYPQGPTATVYGRPFILGSSSQFNGATGGVAISSFLPLPVPKINLMPEFQSYTFSVYNSVTNTISGTYAFVTGAPVLINMDFTSDHFSNPDNRIFIEMVHYKRKSRSGTVASPPIRHKGSTYVVPTKNIANVGHDSSLPWLSIPASGFWSRGGNQYHHTNNPIGIDRPNHYEVLSYTMSSYPIWEYFTGIFEFWDVAYRDITGSNNYLNVLIPSGGKRKAGSNKPTNRFAYSPFYTSYYCAFRYIQWVPTANGGKGQIVSGPLSKIIKVTGDNFPFSTDYINSAVFGYPVCSISTSFVANPDSYRRLKCNWESNVP
jgi:hypothetical protein